MRVLLVAMNYAPERSGTAPYTAGWAQHLSRSHDVTVLAGPPHYPEWAVHPGYGDWTDERTEDGIRVRRLRHVVPRRTSVPARLLHETTFGARVLGARPDSPDAVVAISPPLFGAAAAAVLARRLRVPFGLVVQDIYTEGVRELDAAGAASGAAGRAIGAVESRVVRAADRVLTIHDRFAGVLTDRFGADPDRVDVVPNWTHIPAPRTARDVQRRRLGWEGRFVVLHAGNMGAKQGLENVVEAATVAASRTAGVPVEYVLMGDGNQRRHLEQLAGGVPGLRFLPSVDAENYPDILGAADVLLVNERPGVAEMSLPSKLTSYCAAGRPIVAASSQQGATAQVIRASGAGVLVAPGRPELLAGAVEDLATDPVRAAAFGASGRAHADRWYGPATAMAGYDRWMAQLVGYDEAVSAPPERMTG